MRVLLIAPGGDLFGGGMGTVTRNIKNELLKDKNYSVRVIDSRGEKGFALSFFYLFIAILIYLKELIICNENMVIHINVSERFSFYRKFIFIILAKLFKKKTVLHHHGAELIPFYKGCSPLTKKVVNYCIRNTDLNIVLGEKWKSFLENSVPNHAPIEVLHNAVPTKEIQKKPPEAFTISIIANLSERKGVSLLLEAAKKMQGQFDFKINFIGGGEIEHYKAKAKTMGLEKECVFHGWVSQTDALYLMVSSSVMVLPSYEEGLPMVILEAMAQEVAVVCTPVGSIGEVFTHEQECLLMEVGSAESLYHNLIRINKDKALTQAIIKQAKENYNQHFSIENYITCLTRLYQKL